MKTHGTFLLYYTGIIIILLLILKIVYVKKHKLISRYKSFIILDRILFFISFLGILITSLWDFNYLSYANPIPYKNWKSIQWDDFRGLKMPKDNLDGESKFAFIHSSLIINKSKSKIEIEANFHPCRSYVYNNQIFADRLLTHEIYHFHITEYCARLMRKDIIENIDRGGEICLSDLRTKYFRKERLLQKQYDEETYHSYVYAKQIHWQEKIDSLLISLENYSNPVIILNEQHQNKKNEFSKK
ncbi:hypothetical protein C9994_08595 [Marivirga lumbricoides]|uniref:DUF922 domain-containing protein n=1 Tax=Marivirga lumbricoides TaxID=1046115 RepID=A0A2T4DQS5_9BACT|nr:hypothetical protein C9994_08595 [Marivirga lumbricoides]